MRAWSANGAVISRCWPFTRMRRRGILDAIVKSSSLLCFSDPPWPVVLPQCFQLLVPLTLEIAIHARVSNSATANSLLSDWFQWLHRVVQWKSALGPLILPPPKLTAAFAFCYLCFFWLFSFILLFSHIVWWHARFRWSKGRSLWLSELPFGVPERMLLPTHPPTHLPNKNWLLGIFVQICHDSMSRCHTKKWNVVSSSKTESKANSKFPSSTASRSRVLTGGFFGNKW